LGEDPALTAPRLALALRQAARQMGQAQNFITATKGPGWLDCVALAAGQGSPLDFAAGLIEEVEGARPAGPEAAALLATKRPVIVAGGDAALLATAGNLVLALRRAGVAAQLSLLVSEANSIGLALLDCRPLAAALAACAGRDVVVLERDLTRDAAIAAGIFASAKSVTVLDHIATPSTRNADLALAVASFADSDGIFINLEGRAQPFFKAIFTESDPQPSWQMLRDAAIAAGRLAPAQWRCHAGLLAGLAAIPSLAACTQAWPTHSIARSATLPYRSSGRTAATAHLDVREPLPFQHEDSPLGTTMEGMPMFSSPGWNSVQALHKSQNTAADAREVFLFTDMAGEEFEIPTGATPDPHSLGAEELSNLSPAIIARRAASGP
jgi:NADH-quinone oxidoreductase subunit G